MTVRVGIVLRMVCVMTIAEAVVLAVGHKNSTVFWGEVGGCRLDGGENHRYCLKKMY